VKKIINATKNIVQVLSMIRKKTDQELVEQEYVQTLIAIKDHIQQAQVRAVLAANTELIKLYWTIGQAITQKQEQYGWGSSVIEQLARDLQAAFPGLNGFSRSNLFYIRSFYQSYEKVQQAVGQLNDLPICRIPWGHNVVLLNKLQDVEARLWYAKKAIENGWSRSTLELQIKNKAYVREGKAITNFVNTLPAPHSALAQQSFKDPYIFDFLTLHDDFVERDIEQGMINHVQQLLLELGKGFAFISRQYHIEVGGKDFYIDLLFYHLKLRCYIVVELKAREFDPRDAGQLNFYLSAVDDLLRHPDDKPTIGLLLCKSKNNIVAEYALRDIKKPIGVAEYEVEITKKLPKDLKSSLPTVQEIESELHKKEIAAELLHERKKKTT
jgi:predicted nuclease of restriction endonuclease-like (RecB) superfamily